MIKMAKKIVILSILLLPVSGCTMDSFTQKPIETTQSQPRYVKHSNKEYKSIRRKTYKSPKTTKGTSTQEQMLADLRGIVSEDVYSQLEETQAVNPIRGYSQVKDNNLKKVVKEASVKIIEPKAPEKRIVLKELPKPEPVLVEQKSKILVSKDILMGLTEETILKFLKSPNKVYKSTSMSLWEYKNNTCSAKLYFYAGDCSFIETEYNRIDYNNTDACLNTFGL